MTTDEQMELAVYQWLNPYTTGPDGGPDPGYLTDEVASARLLDELAGRHKYLRLSWEIDHWAIRYSSGNGSSHFYDGDPDRKRAILLAAYQEATV